MLFVRCARNRKGQPPIVSRLTCCATLCFVHNLKVGKLDAADASSGSDSFVLARASLVDKIEMELKGRDLATFRQAPCEKFIFLERDDPDLQVDRLPLSDQSDANACHIHSIACAKKSMFFRSALQ